MQVEALCHQCILTNAAYPLGGNPGHTGSSVESLDFEMTNFVNHKATSCTGAGTNGGTWTRAASRRSSSRR